MTEWVRLSRTEHASARYRPRQGYDFAAATPLQPVLLAELPRLLQDFAVAFVRNGDAVVPVVPTSLDGESNLYVNADGRWLGTYVPAALRGHPFMLAPTASGELTLCVAADHLVTEGPGEPLFADDGELAAPVAQTLNFLQQCSADRARTLAAAAALDAAGLLEPWPLQIKADDQAEPRSLAGLWRVDESALGALSADALAGLRDDGALRLVYAQLLSLHQTSQLVQRARLRAAQQARQSPPATLDELFGESDDELTFE